MRTVTIRSSYVIYVQLANTLSPIGVQLSMRWFLLQYIARSHCMYIMYLVFPCLLLAIKPESLIYVGLQSYMDISERRMESTGLAIDRGQQSVILINLFYGVSLSRKNKLFSGQSSLYHSVSTLREWHEIPLIIQAAGHKHHNLLQNADFRKCSADTQSSYRHQMPQHRCLHLPLHP
jgi:hypothetical protein